MTTSKKLITVGCRISQELREELEQEAEDLELSLSNYVFQLLENRFSEPEPPNNNLAELDTLKTQLTNAEARALKAPSLEVENLLDQLSEVFPTRGRPEILEAALAVCLHNEQTSFFIQKPADFWANQISVINHQN